MAQTKVAYVFPGQGSQYVEMGLELAQQFPAAGDIFRKAEAALGIPLIELCFEGPEESLRDTANAQPAIVAASLAAWAALKAAGGPDADMVAGHSLGEYSALIASGVFDLETGIRLVRRRGELMAQAAAERGGSMAAVIGLDNDVLEAIAAADEGVVIVANLNSPGQAVISGETDAVERVSADAKGTGAKRVIPLAVSGAFHSPLMQSASDAMKAELSNATMQPPSVPIYPNVTAASETDPERMRGFLVEQIVSQVRWEETIRRMIADGVHTFVELGPGKVLSGLIRRIDDSVTAYNVEDSESLERTLNGLKAA